MVRVSVETQLAFISYIQRLVVEGEYSATYKFAMLNALADICIETPESNFTTKLEIPFERLIDKLVQLYWNHSSPFNVDDTGEGVVLLQNSRGQIKFISVIEDVKKQGYHSYYLFKSSNIYQKTIRALKQPLKEGPLERLQKLANQNECFLFPHVFNTANSKNVIVLNEGIADCFRRFYDLVVHVARNEWVKKIESLAFNKEVLGNKPSIERFLFSSERQNLTKVTPVLKEIQSGLCFYCGKPMKQASDAHVDHFIPFARYANDTAHNFVLAHGACNTSKSDYLASARHQEHWVQQNLEDFRGTISTELNRYFLVDPDLSFAISRWAYNQAAQMGAKYWDSKGRFEDSLVYSDLKLVAEPKGALYK